MIHIEQIELFRIKLRTRIPFRYGIAEMRELPHLFLQLKASIDGKMSTGQSADHLPPHWFTKNPNQSHAEEIDELTGVIRHAANKAIGSQSASAFDWWRDAYDSQLAWGSGKGHPPLLAHFGTTLVERALIDAVCRASGESFHTALLSGTLGFDPARVHSELSGFEWKKAFRDKPRQSIHLRHTIGLGDPVNLSDLPADERLNDGLPETTAEAIQAYGISHFKIKLSGKLEQDLQQLHKLHSCLKDNGVASFVYTLDGNEQYPSAEAFIDDWKILSGTPMLTDPSGRLWCVEQPIHRDASFSMDKDWTRQLEGSPALIIDESDGSIESLPRALACGYAGTSHKNCKGVFKGLANKCLITKRSLARSPESPPIVLTGEDLSNVGPIALLQDLTVQATLDIPSIERNGHHFFKGLSAFPEGLNTSVLNSYPHLYQQHPDGYAALMPQKGQLDLRDLFEAGLGSPLVLGMEEFTKRIALS